MFSKKLLGRVSASLLVVVFSIAPLPISAEDIEIYQSSAPSEPPNLLFIMDHSVSMKGLVDGVSKFDALQSAFEGVLANPALTNVNVGLLTFAGRKPTLHGVYFPVSPIDDDAQAIMLSNLLPSYLSDGGNNIGYFSMDDDALPNPGPGQTVRSFLPQILAYDSSPKGATPLLEAFYEAALYFRGEPPVMGNFEPRLVNAAHPSTYSGHIISRQLNVYARDDSPTVTTNTAVYNSPISS